MSNARIVERSLPSGDKQYVIQQRHFLFRWWWVDAWLNSLEGAACVDSFPTMEAAIERLPYFDDTHPRTPDIVVYPKP